jgi:hypothetical protein
MWPYQVHCPKRLAEKNCLPLLQFLRKSSGSNRIVCRITLQCDSPGPLSAFLRETPRVLRVSPCNYFEWLLKMLTVNGQIPDAQGKEEQA